MYNPRHSFISSNTTTTYPSTLSSNTPLTPPASPRHPSRLHRSSKRHLRAQASVASLRPINEDEQVRQRGAGKDAAGEERRGIVGAVPESLRPSSMASANTLKVPTRPSSVNATATRAVPSSRPSSTQPTPSKDTGRLKPKSSAAKLRSTSPAKARANELIGLGLTLDQPDSIITQIKPVQAIAQPRRPKPIDVNPRKESMADEWERELIHSARNLHIGMSQQQASGIDNEKGKGAKDLEWERSGSWQEEIDPIREAEDRSRRDLKGEKAFPPERPRAPIRAGSNGVTSVHIGVRPRLHPSRANSSMTHNQPDDTLPLPIGSPLSISQAQNLPSANTAKPGLRFTDDKLQKAQAEYEEWLSKKDERESGVGHPHDYSTRDWASKGRIPARPAALDAIQGESSTMAQQQPQQIRPAQVPRQPPIQAPAPAPTPIPILVHADPETHPPPRESILVTPVEITSIPQASIQKSHDPAYLAEPHYLRPGNLSSQPSMENIHAGYMYGQDPQTSPYAIPPGMDPMTAWQYQYPYPYDPSFGYAMDPAMYQQYWNANNSWYGPQYNTAEQYDVSDDGLSRGSKVHFEDTPGASASDLAVKGVGPQADDQYDPMPQGYDSGAYQQPATPYGGIGFGLGGHDTGGGQGMGQRSMMGTPIGGGMGGGMMGGGMMGAMPGGGMGGMGSMSRGMAFGMPHQANSMMGAMGPMGGMGGMSQMGGMGMGMGAMGQSGNSMMGYPQQMGFPMGNGVNMGMGGMGKMGQMGQMGQMGTNPYMMQQQQQQQQQMMPNHFQGSQGAASMGGASGQLDALGNELKPFDSTQMKRGRMGHYGYLEGRELAGPPVGYLPAGMQPTGPASPSQGARSNISPAPASVSPMTMHAHGQSQGPGSYMPSGSVAGTGPYAQSGASGSMWGDSSNMPRARYDGKPGGGHVQADTDTPYPRVEGRGMSTSWTPWQDGAPVESDYRYSVGHRGRMREGRV